MEKNGPNLAKFDQILTKCWAKFFLSFHHQMGFRKMLDSSSMNFFVNRFKSYYTWCVGTTKGRFLYNLAAFKVTNFRKGAQTHEG